MYIEKKNGTARIRIASVRNAVGKSSEDIRNRKLIDAELEDLRFLFECQAAGDNSSINYEDIPPLTDEQLANMALLRDCPRKKAVSVRLDEDILEWLRSKGRGHLTRINGILANVMAAEQRTNDRRKEA